MAYDENVPQDTNEVGSDIDQMRENFSLLGDLFEAIGITVDDSSFEFTANNVQEALDSLDNAENTDAIQDLVAAFISWGDKLSGSYDDSAGTLTVSTSALDQEEVDDFVASMVQAGNAITVSRDDASDQITISVDESAISHDNISDVQPNQHEDTALYDSNGNKVAEVDADGNIDVLRNSIDTVSTLTATTVDADNIILSGEYGARWDRSNSSPSLTRLGSAQGLGISDQSITNGTKKVSDFDNIWPWAGMKRCNLADDGTVNAFYGDADYAEDGSNGQVMVRIPKFYYYHPRNGNIDDFWISPKPKPNYEIHPDFVRGGEIKDFIYVGAYEATIYDSSAGSYVGDGITYDYSNDIMASVADLQPISGNSNHLDILEARQLASNRGSGWAQHDFFNMTAWQLLAVVEYANFNFQSVLSEGITNLDSGSGNHSQNTGHTSSLGNSSGEVVISTLENGATGATETYACSYRGIENPYGNLWNFTDGFFVKDDGYYIESDPSNWNSDGAGYTHIPTTPINSDGYIDDIDYLTELDYQFFASSTGGSSSTYLCDYQWSHDSGETNILLLGGRWSRGSKAGLFCSHLALGVGRSYRAFGSRLEFVG